MSRAFGFVADGGDRLRRAIAVLPPEQRRAVRRQLALPPIGRRCSRQRPCRTLPAGLVWLRECCAADPRLYVARCVGAGFEEVAMSVVTRPLTYEDLCRAREDGNRYELIEGELILVAAPSPKHQWVSYLLGVAFHRTVVEPGIGVVFAAPVDVHLAGGSYVQPDLLVVLRERVSIIGDTLIEGAPDLVVEILSASSRTIDRRRKLALYARSGVREYWMIDAAAGVITIHADPVGDGYRVVRRETTVARSTILPDLAVELAELFGGWPGAV